MLSANPEANVAGTLPNGEAIRAPATDVWRMLGRTTPVALTGGAGIASMTLPEIMASGMLTTSVYDVLEAARRRTALAPWLELLNPFR